MNDFPPLQAPLNWPPQEINRTRLWRRIVNLFHFLTFSPRNLETNEAIEAQILDQLKERPKGIKLYCNSPLRQQIADLFANSVRSEKHLEYVTLHPDDRVVLLLWGPYDDLTPALFGKGLKSAFGKDIPWMDCLQAELADKTTVEQLVDYCATAVSLP